MSVRVDPRAWNLLAGLGLIASGCGGRIIGSDDGDGSSTDDTNESSSSDGSTSSSDGSTDESESAGPECSQDSDCLPSYHCIDGACEYWGSPDGGNELYECYPPDQDDCDLLEQCLDHYCTPVLELSGCRPTAELGIPLTIAETPLALTFVDLDADGAAELVAATQTDFHAFESGSDVASVSARVVASPNISAMVAGDFAPNPGQDLTLLVDDTLLVHASDGIAGFEAPSTSASPQVDSLGLVAGEFDDVAPDDLLVWSEHGASVIAAEASTLYDAIKLQAAAAHDLSSGNGRFVLREYEHSYFYSLDGVVLAGTQDDVGTAAFVVAIANPEHLDFNATVFGTVPENTWTLFELWDLDQPHGLWGVAGSISAMASGDLDADGRDEVALLLDGGVALVDNLASGSECTSVLDLGGLTGATHLAIGDHDGDGDSELAIAFAIGEILVFDGEG
jgi:hypothetical protein